MTVTPPKVDYLPSGMLLGWDEFLIWGIRNDPVIQRVIRGGDQHNIDPVNIYCMIIARQTEEKYRIIGEWNKAMEEGRLMPKRIDL